MAPIGGSVIRSLSGDSTGWARQGVWPATAAAVGGILLSVAAWFGICERENKLAELELRERAASHALMLQNGIKDQLSRFAAVRALFQAIDKDISRQEFAAFANLVLDQHSAVKGVSWIPRVGRHQREAIEKAAIGDGLRDYRIKRVAGAGLLTPSPEQNEYFPIFYSTEAFSSAVYGIDLNSEKMRKETIERARDTAQPATSAIFMMHGGVGDRHGFFVLLPVYKPGQPYTSIAERRQNLIGFILGTFQVSTVMETILALSTTPAGLDLYLFSADASRDASPVFFHASRRRTEPIEGKQLGALLAGPHWSGELAAGDARWTLLAAPIPGGPGTSRHYAAWVTLLVGLCLTAIISAYIKTSARRSAEAHRRASQALATQNVHFDTALDNMRQGLVMFDADECIVACNDRYLRMYALSHEVVKPGCTLRQLLRHRAERGNLEKGVEDYRTDLLRALAHGSPAPFSVETADGQEISVTVKRIVGAGWIAIHDDITERRQTEARISHMALHDALTDLPNRSFFSEHVASRLSRLVHDQRFAVICVGIDNFKAVNDTLGHRGGDELLCQLGGRLRSCLSEGDTLARLGGDEFAILLNSVSSPTDVQTAVSKLSGTVVTPFDLTGTQINCSISVGIAVAPTDATDADQLLKNADMALHRAKADGGGACRFFEAEMDARMQARHALEFDLRRALGRSEFELYYQPIVNLAAGTTTAFEALIRWNHPQRGQVSPAEFIPIAEETGLIAPIGEWVLGQACSDAASWPRSVSVAVNLSPVQLKTTRLVATVLDVLARSGLAPERLQLEITEAVLLSNSDATRAALHQLRASGVRICMDDFGTGYSSLSYLRSFPFDKIKIDRSFVHDLRNTDSAAIIRAIISLGKSLGMSTTAEGIETVDQLEHLSGEGCTEGQGYLFSKPHPAREVQAFLSRDAIDTMAVA